MGRLVDPCTFQPSTFPLLSPEPFTPSLASLTSPAELKEFRPGSEPNSREPAGVDLVGAVRY